MTTAKFVTEITQILASRDDVTQRVTQLASEIADYRNGAPSATAGRHASIAITSLENVKLALSREIPVDLLDTLTLDGGEQLRGYARHELITAALHIAQLA